MSMIPRILDEAEHVTVVDTEYVHKPGERVELVYCAWMPYPGSKIYGARREELLTWTQLPFPTGPRDVLVAYQAGAEAGFLYNLPVVQPWWFFDCMVEEQMDRNVAVSKTRRAAFAKRHPELHKPGMTIGLLEAAALFGIEGGSQEDKDASRDVIMSGAWRSGDEAVWQRIEAYCQHDVFLTAELFGKLEPRTCFQQALLRGAYAAEVGRMGQRGIPADSERYQRLCEHYKQVLIGYRQGFDPDGVKLSPGGGIRQKWWQGVLDSIGRTERYPRTATGRASTREEHVLRLARDREDHAELAAIATWLHLKKLLPETKGGRGLRGPALGSDGRFRYDMFAFATHTGRSLGKSTEALLQMAAWFRGFISPQPGEVLGYIDYSGQEVAIAAALSQDEALRQAYLDGDVYVNVARMAGAITAGTSEDEVRRVRRIYKTMVLGANYGMGFRSFWERSGVSHAAAARVWQFFQRRFAKLGLWQRHSLALARKRGWVQTKWGWRARVFPDTRRTALLNWPIQGAGAEVLRVGVLRAAAEGYHILAVAYDALLVSVPEAGAEARLEALQGILEEAAEMTVGIRIRTDCKIIRPGGRLLTGETEGDWTHIMELLDTATVNL